MGWANAIIKRLISFYVDKLNLKETCLISSTVNLEVGRNQVASRERSLGLFRGDGKPSVLARRKKGSNQPELIKLTPVGK